MSENRYISYPVLLAAKQGDAEAINTILDYFRGYINSRSLRSIYRPDGSTYMAVDEDIRHRMETTLINAIFKFEFR